MKNKLIYISMFLSLFTNIDSMEEQTNKKIEIDGQEEHINLPPEIQLHVFEELIKNVVNNNNIFDPYNGVEETVKNIRLTHSDFNGLKKLLMKFANRYIREQFASELIGLEPDDKDARLEDIFKNIQTNHSKEAEIEAAKLIIAGANPNLLIAYGAFIDYYPLLIVIAKTGKLKKILKLLIRYGARIDEKDENGRTALMEATDADHIDIVKLLIKAGANVNAKDTREMTALMDAGYYGHEDIVELLIKSGADVNVKNFTGKTALMMAAIAGSTGAAKLLIKNAKDHINTRDYNGQTALDWAKAYKHADTIELLKAAGAQE